MFGTLDPHAVRRPLRSAALFLTFLFLVSTPCAFPDDAFGAEDTPQIPPPVHLRAIVRPKFPLLSVKENAPGRPEGMAIDILEAIGKEQGISFTWVVLSPDADLEGALRRGEGDIAADWGETTKRSREFVFSVPYIALPVNVYIRKGSSAVEDARRLEGRKVGVVLRNVADEILSARTDLRIVRYDAIHEALFHLLSGDIDAVAHLGPILLEEARKAQVADKISLVEPALADSPRSFAVRKGNAAVVHRLDASLNGMIATPGYRQIYLKWFGPPVQFWTWRRVLALNAAAVLAAVAFLGGWHYLSLLRLNRALAEGKRLEEELRKSEAEKLSAQKYEAVGKLAAGTAHHVNNLMTIVSGYGSILLRKMEPFDPHRKEIREMMYAGDRAAALAAQLLAFGRRTIIIPKVASIDGLIEGVVPSLRSLLGDGIDLSVRTEADGAAVRVDARPFGTMIEELARNAKEAMPEGGRLEITTGVREVEGSDGNGAWSPQPGRYATVSVSDTGCGMDREALSHLFEPFYTTRGFGRGMGLPSVYGFVKQSTGFIDVQSRPLSGTSVTIGFPLAGEADPA